MGFRRGASDASRRTRSASEETCAPVIPIENVVHLCIDMQRIFAKGEIWEAPWMEGVLPTIAEISARYAAPTIFTCFITPATPEEAGGPVAVLFPALENCDPTGVGWGAVRSRP